MKDKKEKKEKKAGDVEIVTVEEDKRQKRLKDFLINKKQNRAKTMAKLRRERAKLAGLSEKDIGLN